MPINEVCWLVLCTNSTNFNGMIMKISEEKHCRNFKRSKFLRSATVAHASHETSLVNNEITKNFSVI
jgi:hypothetical protein